MSGVRMATKAMFERYRDIIADLKVDPSDRGETGIANLAWMCGTAIAAIDAYPIDKLSRWLGFVQGVLATRGIVTVAAERDFSRPLFHAAYKATGTDIPPTKSRDDHHAGKA